MTEKDQYVCEDCGAKFSTHYALNGHQAQGHDKPWRDKTTLKNLYIDEELSSREIADRLGCESTTIIEWLKRFDIETRSVGRRRNEQVKISTKDGHEVMQIRGVDGNPYTLTVHRMLMIAEKGLESVKNSDVHHKNGIGWDNRMENLEIVNRSEHSKIHHRRGDMVCISDVEGRVVDKDDVAEIRELWKECDYTQSEIAEMYNTTPSNVSNIVNQNTWSDV